MTMRAFVQVRVVLAVALCVAAFGSANGWAQDTERASVKRSEALESYMRSEVEKEGFAGAVVVAQAGEPLLKQGYGLADLEHNVPNTPVTKFRLGSVTKQFTAMAVLILAEQGKLGIDDPISKFLDETPEAWSGITIRHLLNHTSGIPNFTSQITYLVKMRLHQSHKDMVARFRDLPLEFEPGSEFRYSNSGYYLLGMIIEKASGQSYADFVQESILKPLGMDDTGYDQADLVLPGRARGYQKKGGKLVNAPYLDMSQPFAAGALYSTIEDLMKWDRALAAKQLVSEASYNQMFEPARDGYAFGWIVRERKGSLEQLHSGGINGFNTFVLRRPRDDLFIAVLSNINTDDLSRILLALTAIASGEEVKKPADRVAVPVDPNLLDAYVGVYELNPKFRIEVTRDGDRLFVQATGQSRLEVFPESETDFFLKEVDAQVTFVKGEDGKAVSLILHQNGLDQKVARVESEAPSPPK